MQMHLGIYISISFEESDSEGSKVPDLTLTEKGSCIVRQTP